jgi:hypothetical protein
VCYSFWRDGIFARGGPLRPYSLPECRVLVADLMDGYFPWELKEDYPDGVPLRCEMHLDVPHGHHDTPHAPFVPFQGPGNLLADPARRPEAAAAGAGAGAVGGSWSREVWQAPEGRGGAQGLFRRLPEAVVRAGEIVPVRVRAPARGWGRRSSRAAIAVEPP